MANSEIYDFATMNKYICEKTYYVETKDSLSYTGYMLNYNGGSCVLLTVKGIVHLSYYDIWKIVPVNPDNELLYIIEDITHKKYEDVYSDEDKRLKRMDEEVKKILNKL